MNISNNAAHRTNSALHSLSGSRQQQINELRQISQQLAEVQIATFARFDQVQSEIRGLRIETQRMLDAYLNPDTDEDNQN